MLILRPTGGLCNRMLALDSGVALCKEINHELNVHWVKNHYLNASYTDLFLPISIDRPRVYFQETSRKEFLYSDRELEKIKQLIYNRLLKIYQGLFFNKVIHSVEVEKLVKSGFDFKNLKQYKTFHISSFHRFYGNKIDIRLFQPIPVLAKKIDSIAKQFSGNAIGIHIRRGDHRRSILRSPTSLFIKKMNEELANNPDTIFYLASDSEEEKTTLKALFGERLLIQDAEMGDRNSTSGMQKAVIDLFCLSKTNKIYGSFFSTFSVVASEIHGIPFEEIYQDTP